MDRQTEPYRQTYIDRQTDRHTYIHTDIDIQTDMEKLTVAFCNSANASKNYRTCSVLGDEYADSEGL